MKKTMIYAVLLTGSATLAAFAHSGATGVVRERMDAMMEMGKAVKTVTPMMSGETAYDAEAVRAAAETFRRHGGETMTSLFPEGSGDAPSEAKAAIWSEPERFAALADRLEVYAEGLIGAADNGLAAEAQADASMMMGGDMMSAAPGMMGGGAETVMSALEVAQMPADAAFEAVAQVCSACHARYRSEKD
jgi:cytochrome c556